MGITRCKNCDFLSALIYIISKFLFIVTLQSLAKVSSILVGLSRSLQKPGIDIIKAFSDISLVENCLQTLREHSETEFASIFDQASTLAQKMEVFIDKPRTVKKVYRYIEQILAMLNKELTTTIGLTCFYHCWMVLFRT